MQALAAGEGTHAEENQGCNRRKGMNEAFKATSMEKLMSVFDSDDLQKQKADPLKNEVGS